MRILRLHILLLLFGALMTVVTTVLAEPSIGGLGNLTGDSALLRGRVLLSELNCRACHQSKGAAAPAEVIAPNLSMIGHLANADYLEQFIAAPHTVKPGTRMPDLLGGHSDANRQETARALTQFLMSVRDPEGGSRRVPPGSVENGRKLYSTIGCVVCHPDASAMEWRNGLERKFSLASVVAFLKEPLRHRPSGRMPDMKLSHFEAVDIGTFLVGNKTASGTLTLRSELVAQGRELFANLGCSQCHRGTSVKPERELIPFGDSASGDGCLSGRKGGWPAFQLSQKQRQDLRVALDSEGTAAAAVNEIAFELTRLNCIACHERDGAGGPSATRQAQFSGADPNLGNQGRIPPLLTGVGAKLKPEWLRKVLVHGESVRPYLNTRMPRFGAANVERLAGLFARVDKSDPVQITRVRDAKKAKDDGRKLAGSRGLNCVACHTFRLESAAPIRALDLTTMTERLQENWFHQYLRNPQRYQPLTIMPNFWPDGVAALRSVQGGDAGKQMDVLWQYLSYGRNVRAPSGIVLEPLPLLVKDEAVMLRRNFPGIGRRGIGVGYPAGINLSFDAGQMRLASIWRGEFIEASPAWRGQGSGAVRILSREVVRFPVGAAFALLPDTGAAWPTNQSRQLPGFQFKGYTLDQLRRPTFSYEFSGSKITDRFLDGKDQSGRAYFERTILIDPPVERLYFRAASIDARRARPPLQIKSKSTSIGRFDDLRFDLSGKGELKLEYHW